MSRLRASVLLARALQSCSGTAQLGSLRCGAGAALLPPAALRSLPAAASSCSAGAYLGLAPSHGLRQYWASPAAWQEAKPGPDRGAGSSSSGPKEGGVVEQKQAFDDLTDQIPHIVRPMGVVEGTSYTVLIIAGLAFAAAVVWAVVNELLIQPREYTCFNLTLKRLQDDPRVTVRLGTPISGYGQESRNRQARQRIPHRTFTDQHGVEHTQVQFFARGPSGNARVSADMYQDERREWQYAFLYLEVDSPVPQRVMLVEPKYRQPLPAAAS